ncbi:MAG: hypothetical protein U0T81_01155 [Saprospiraceae bacterium]
MNRIILVFSILWATLQFSQLNAQCTPSADNCEDANVLCSLGKVNGYMCQNPDYSNQTGCSPLCPGTFFSAQNTGWWAFVTNGGNVCITLTWSGCRDNNGVQIGIWGDCDCNVSSCL